MLPSLLFLFLWPASRHAEAAGVAMGVPIAASVPIATGWAGVVAGISPIVTSQSALNPQLIGLNSVLSNITARLATDESGGLKSMDFVHFMPKKYQADPAAFAAQDEARQVAGLLKGVRAAGDALDQEASELSAKMAAGTASAVEIDRLTAIRENSFYLSSAVRSDVENVLARVAAPVLVKAERISMEPPIRQGAAFDGANHLAGESSPISAADSRGARKKRLALKPYRRKSDAPGGLVTIGSAKIRKQEIKLANGALFSVRPGAAADVSPVTGLIHDAFSIWKERGLSLGPMYQTDEQTASYLVSKGYVAENSKGELSGTFSLDDGSVRRNGKTKIHFTEGGESIDYSRIGDSKASLPVGRLLVFKKAAVKRDTANSGLGFELYALAEKTGRENGYSGMVLETVKEADWLYDWYVRLGFRPIGSYRYPGRQVDTILMIKPFSEGK
jgi:hypothetical protein